MSDQPTNPFAVADDELTPAQAEAAASGVATPDLPTADEVDVERALAVAEAETSADEDVATEDVEIETSDETAAPTEDADGDLLPEEQADPVGVAQLHDRRHRLRHGDDALRVGPRLRLHQARAVGVRRLSRPRPSVPGAPRRPSTQVR